MSNEREALVMKLALNIVSLSSSADHSTALAWGQWCREVVRAGLNGDEEELDRLAQRVPASLRAAQAKGCPV